MRLTDFAERKPAQLSGGQQQRVALARALVNYPSALLLDEPLGALDLKLRQVMQFELKRIQREVGITFVYVTHDQEEALTMSDRIAVMNAGNVDQIGTPDRDLRPARRRCSSPASSARPTCGPARQTGRANRDFVEVEVLGTTLKARPGDTTIEPGGQATLMVRPERVRVSMDAPTGDVATVRATVTRPDVPGSGGAAVAGRARRLDRSSRMSAPSRTCRCCARATRSTSAGPPRRRWCCRPPTSRPPRISRRCSTTRDRRPSIRSLPSEIHERHSRHAPERESIPGSSSRLAANRTSRRRFIGGGAAAAAAVALGASFLAACSSEQQVRHRHVSIDARRDPPAARCGSRTGRCTWPTASSPRSRRPSGLTVDYKEDFNDNEQWFAKVKEPLSRKQDIGADLVVPTQFMAARINGSAGSTRSATPACPTGRTCAPTCWIRSVDPGRKFTRALHVRHGRAGLQQGRHRS